LESSPPRNWTSADRKALFLWLVITFGIPILLLFLLRPGALHPPSVWTIQGDLSSKSVAAFCVLLATWLVARLQKRSMADYGIPLRKALGGRFWEGALWGFAMLSALLLLLHAFGQFQINSVALTGSAFFKYALGWALAFYCVGISEEFAFRGYLFFIAARRIRFWRAAVALSIGFAVAHLPNPGETLLGILQVLAVGLLFCLTIRRTGNLWFAVGFHASWDWAQTFFYGTPDSGLLGEGHFLNSSVQGPNWVTGGSAGPEGSIFALLILSFSALLIHWRFPKPVYPDRPA